MLLPDHRLLLDHAAVHARHSVHDLRHSCDLVPDQEEQQFPLHANYKTGLVQDITHLPFSLSHLSALY